MRMKWRRRGAMLTTRRMMGRRPIRTWQIPTRAMTISLSRLRTRSPMPTRNPPGKGRARVGSRMMMKTRLMRKEMKMERRIVLWKETLQEKHPAVNSTKIIQAPMADFHSRSPKTIRQATRTNLKRMKTFPVTPISIRTTRTPLILSSTVTLENLWSPLMTARVQTSLMPASTRMLPETTILGQRTASSTRNRLTKTKACRSTATMGSTG
mmetsp:Transcript_2328/g.6232  ORF Transcript_2328/g.6232 Transcript_2328/m.6232 type:complete len:210 (+) Transcript_2328:716-1345(+)